MISRPDIIHLMVRCGPFVTKAVELIASSSEFDFAEDKR